jgi:CRP-like cAMP-binding protein
VSQSIPDMVLRRAGTGPAHRQPKQALRRTRRETAAALSHVPLFTGFSNKDLTSLAEDTDVVSFSAGQRVVEEGMLGEAMFVILTGEATVLKGQRRLGTMRPGDFFGEVAVLDGSPRSATVIAATPMTAIRLFRRTLLRFLKAEPQLAITILDGIVRRIRALTSSLDA